MNDVIEIEVELVTDRRSTWVLLTEARHIANWFGKHVSLEAHEGGRFVETWQSGARSVITGGVVDQIVPQERIGWTWKDDDWPVETHLRFTLADANGGTKLMLEHSGWVAIYTATGRNVRQEHESGWRMYMERLVDYARTCTISGS